MFEKIKRMFESSLRTFTKMQTPPLGGCVADGMAAHKDYEEKGASLYGAGQINGIILNISGRMLSLTEANDHVKIEPGNALDPENVIASLLELAYTDSPDFEEFYTFLIEDVCKDNPETMVYPLISKGLREHYPKAYATIKSVSADLGFNVYVLHNGLLREADSV